MPDLVATSHNFAGEYLRQMGKKYFHVSGFEVILKRFNRFPFLEQQEFAGIRKCGIKLVADTTSLKATGCRHLLHQFMRPLFLIFEYRKLAVNNNHNDP